MLKRRICYLTPLPTDFPMVGVRLRIDQIITAIHELDFVDLHVWRPEQTAAHETVARGNALVTTCTNLAVAGLALATPFLPQTVSPSTEQHIMNWLRELRPDLVLVTHPMFTALVPALIRAGFAVVVDTYNVEQSIARQSVSQAKSLHERATALCQYAVMRRKEDILLAMAKEVWAASEGDVHQFSRIGRGRTPLALVPNVIDIDRYEPAPDSELATVGFIADFSYLPNEIAAEQILCNILPTVRETTPAVRLYLVGRNPSPRLRSLAAETPDVTVTGTVDDTRPWIARCSVLLAPIEQGSGTRLKILEALAMAKPVVSTAKGCEGLDVQDGTHLVIRDIPSFPAAIASLLRNPGEARAMGQRGRALVAEKYSVAGLRMILGARLEAIFQTGAVSSR